MAILSGIIGAEIAAEVAGVLIPGISAAIYGYTH
jgi:hypothetical protein